MNGNLLSRHHEELERRIATLLTRADGGDGHLLADEWRLFERELLRHFDLEERLVLPRFQRDDPDEAAALHHEHATLRADLLAYGIRADLHFLRAEAVRGFIADLRAHAAHEDRVLYGWAEQNLDEETWAEIAIGLGQVQAPVTFGAPPIGDARTATTSEPPRSQ